MKIINADQKIHMVAPGKLKRHPRNVRRGDREVIAESVSNHGFFGAIIVQSSTGHVLVGNHRFDVAVQEGAPEIPVIYVDVDDDRALRIMLADNKASDSATNDKAELASLLDELRSKGGLRGTLYKPAELSSLLDDLAKTAAPTTRRVEFNATSGGEEGAGSHPPREEPDHAVVGGRGLGTPIVSYTLVFDDDAQQQRWFRFVREMKKRYPDQATIGARLDRYLAEVVPEAVG